MNLARGPEAEETGPENNGQGTHTDEGELPPDGERDTDGDNEASTTVDESTESGTRYGG